MKKVVEVTFSRIQHHFESACIGKNSPMSEMSAIVSLTKAQVPSYLVDSEFYNNLSADEEDAFDIPQEYFKSTVNVSNAKDLAHLFHTMKFWGLLKLPREIINLLVMNHPTSVPADEHELICNVLLEFDTEFGLHTLYRNLHECSWQHQRITLAIECGRVEILEHIFRIYAIEDQRKFSLIKSAAENGHLQLLKQILDSTKLKNPLREVSVVAVASHGHLDCLRFLFEKGCKKHKDTCRAASENGHLDCLKFAHEQGCAWNKTVRNVAAARGHLHCLKYTFEHGCPVDADVACEAAQTGQLECLQYILDQGGKMTKRVCESAVTGGNLQCVKLLHERKAPILTTNCAKIAASSGNLPCLQYLLDANCEVGIEATHKAAVHGHDLCLELLLQRKGEMDAILSLIVLQTAEIGHTACVKMFKKFGVTLGERVDETVRLLQFVSCKVDLARSLFEGGYEVPPSTIEHAVGNGNIECVEYLCTNKLCPLTAKLTVVAAGLYRDSLLMLKVLHQYNCPWSIDACKQLAERCDIVSLTFAHENGAPWDEGTTTAAIQRDGLACLMYALKEGCPLSQSACDVAASRGLIGMLKLLHERGCVLTLKTCVEAARNKFVDCLTYAVTHGAPMDATVCKAAATCRGMLYTDHKSENCQTALEVLQCARALGCPWDERTCAAAAATQRSDITCLQYAHENGCPWDASTTHAAVSAGTNLHTLSYMLKNGCPFDAEACLVAAQHDYLPCLLLLREHGCPWDERVSRAAAVDGGGACLPYCVENGCPIDAATMIEYNRMIHTLDEVDVGDDYY